MGSPSAGVWHKGVGLAGMSTSLRIGWLGLGYYISRLVCMLSAGVEGSLLQVKQSEEQRPEESDLAIVGIRRH
jgi:hypothetical protein